MIRRFKEISGRQIEKITGQERFAFAHSDTNDFYDLAEQAKTGGYEGSVIIFYDFETGDVYRPFEKKRNVLYGDPVYVDGFYYILQGDYDENRITLYRYIPGEAPLKVTELDINDVNLYNLRIIGNPVHIISMDDNFECYYPERFSFPIDEAETVAFTDGEKIYFERWAEEGWDKEKDRAGDGYKYYNKIIVKDPGGNTLSEEVGAFYPAEDGTWWIA